MTTSDGKRRKVPKGQLIAMQLVTSGVKGNIKSIEFLLKLADIMKPPDAVDEVPRPISEAERKLLMDYFASIQPKGSDDQGSE